MSPFPVLVDSFIPPSSSACSAVPLIPAAGQRSPCKLGVLKQEAWPWLCPLSLLLHGPTSGSFAPPGPSLCILLLFICIYFILYDISNYRLSQPRVFRCRLDEESGHNLAGMFRVHAGCVTCKKNPLGPHPFLVSCHCVVLGDPECRVGQCPHTATKAFLCERL